MTAGGRSVQGDGPRPTKQQCLREAFDLLVQMWFDLPLEEKQRIDAIAQARKAAKRRRAAVDEEERS